MGAAVRLVIRTASRTVSPGGASSAKFGRAARAALRLTGPTDQDPFPFAGAGARVSGSAGASAVGAAVPAGAAARAAPGAVARAAATAAAAIRDRGLIDHLGVASSGCGTVRTG